MSFRSGMRPSCEFVLRHGAVYRLKKTRIMQQSKKKLLISPAAETVFIPPAGCGQTAGDKAAASVCGLQPRSSSHLKTATMSGFFFVVVLLSLCSTRLYQLCCEGNIMWSILAGCSRSRWTAVIDFPILLAHVAVAEAAGSLLFVKSFVDLSQAAAAQTWTENREILI